MDERAYLVKAQEAEAFADAASDQDSRSGWEAVAQEYRRLAQTTQELLPAVAAQKE